MSSRHSTMIAVPIERTEANKFVDAIHRHHEATARDKFRVGCAVGGKLVGVVQVGNPVARALCDGMTLEVVRLCTDGTKDVCSFLYAKAARIAREMGYAKIITYILADEPGTSLRAAGWKLEAIIKGHSWDTPSRPRHTTAPTCDKKRYALQLASPVTFDSPEWIEEDDGMEQTEFNFPALSGAGD